MNDTILKLKKLNVAYMAALEHDYCPDPEDLTGFEELRESGLSDQSIQDALGEHCGRRPDEIASEMSDLIKTLEP